MTYFNEKLQKLHNEFLVSKPNGLIYDSYADQVISYIRDIITTSIFVDAMHVGSTAIPNIKNRPIITINIAVQSVQSIRQFFGRFFEEGWQLIIDDPDEILIRRDVTTDFEADNGCAGYQVYFITKLNRQWIFKRDFRNYMRAHPDEAKRYEDFKIELFNRIKNEYPPNQWSGHYGCEKASFVLEILKKCGHTHLRAAPPDHQKVKGDGCILGNPSHLLSQAYCIALDIDVMSGGSALVKPQQLLV